MNNRYTPKEFIIIITINSTCTVSRDVEGGDRGVCDLHIAG